MFRRLLFAVAILLFASVLFAAHGFVAWRMVLDPGVPEPWRTLLIATIGLGALLLVAQPVAERTLPPRYVRVVAWPASLWMGFAFLLVTLLGLSELTLWFAGGPALAATAGADAAEPFAGIRAGGVLALTCVACVAALREGLAPPRHVREHFEIERWPRALDGFRIVQLSDVHIGPLLDRRFAAELVSRVNALEPDLVVVTGDLVDGRAHHLADEVAPLRGLRAKHGIYFVTGNHDHLSHAPSWVDTVSALGIEVLRNRRVTIGEGDDAFDLVGIDDHHADVIGGGGEDLDAALEGRDPERAAVLLAHDPSTFRRARRLPIDLQISGHTHGGQIWPFRYVVRLVIPWVAGRYREGRAQLYVSRGTGFWGPPMRLFAPAEITELVISAPVAVAA